MGRLLYGTPPSSHHFDDRVLAHLQTVITSRFRRGEGFLLTIEGDGETLRTELWLHPTLPLRYEYDEPVAIELNPLWLRELANSSNGRLGLHLVAEPPVGPDPRAKRASA